MIEHDIAEKRSALREALGLEAKATGRETVERVLDVLRALDVSRADSSSILEALLAIENDPDAPADEDIYVEGLEIVSHSEHARIAAHRAFRGAHR